MSSEDCRDGATSFEPEEPDCALNVYAGNVVKSACSMRPFLTACQYVKKILHLEVGNQDSLDDQ